MNEKTLVILKPGCLQRGIAGEIISRVERKGLKISGMKLDLISKEKASIHYEEHKEKPFYKELVDFITSDPVVLMVVEGDNAISIIRKLAGATKVEDSLPGTIRGDFALHTGKNIIHASDGEQSSKREINIFFKEEEILNYKRNYEEWI
jgi:nucleoside-diphosphate kinase